MSAKIVQLAPAWEGDALAEAYARIRDLTVLSGALTLSESISLLEVIKAELIGQFLEATAEARQ